MRLTDERHADEGGDFKRREFRIRRARVFRRIAHHDRFSCPCDADKFIPYKIGKTMRAEKTWHIVTMPVMIDDDLFGRFVDLDKGAD